MRDYVEVIILICFIKLRWWYFHINPWYVKFSMGGDSKEVHFQNIKSGGIHSQVFIEFHKDSPFHKNNR